MKHPQKMRTNRHENLGENHREIQFLESQLLSPPAPEVFPEKRKNGPKGPKSRLGGGFKYFLFSPLFGEMIQFD